MAGDRAPDGGGLRGGPRLNVAIDLRCLSIQEKAERGTGRNLRDLVGGLAGAAEDVRLVVLLAPGQEPPAGPFETVRLPWPYGDISRRAWWRESWRTGRFLRGLPIDLYHAPDLYIPRGYDGPIVVTVHDCFDLPFLGPVRLFGRTYPWHWNARFRWRYRWTWRSLRRATAIVANSHTTASRVMSLHPSLREKITVVPWGIEDGWGGGPRDREAIVESLGLSRPILLHVGGFEARKNPRGVLRTFERLRDRYPSATLVLVGPPHGDRPDRPGVRYLGYVPAADLEALYHAADLLLLPSFDEGFGFPVLEALACGCPVVTSRGTATEEIAAGRARLVDPTRPDEIFAAVLETLAEPRPAPWRQVPSCRDTAAGYLAVYRSAVRHGLGKKPSRS